MNCGPGNGFDANVVARATPAGRTEISMKHRTHPRLEELKTAAREACSNAYCPYSRFPVGAAILAESGAVYVGCNVENASYGLTICAERNAAFRMAAAGDRRIVVTVIFTPTETPSAPCGACRQVLNEFGPDSLVISACNGPEKLVKTLSELLPDAFGPGNLAR